MSLTSHFWRAHPVALATIVVAGASAHGQTISCADRNGKTTACSATVSAPWQDVAVTILSEAGPISDVSVSFEQSRGTLTSIQVKTGADGVARTTWHGNAGPQDDPVTIKVVAKKDPWSTAASYVLKMPAQNSLALSISEGRESGDRQSWYIGRELVRPVRVFVTGASSSTECSAAMVTFKASGGGAAMPDSTPARWENNRCSAEARWKLDNVVGEQFMSARVRGSDAPPPSPFRAVARNTPWVAAGLAWTYVSGYTQLATSSQQLQIVTGSAAAETTQTVNVKTSRPKTLAAASTFAPILGVNTPISTSWTRVRVSLSADIQNVTTDWFAGISLPQLWGNVYNDDIGVDLQFVVHLSRRQLVTDALCTDACDTKTRTRPVGAGLVAQVNAGSMLTAVMTFFK